MLVSTFQVINSSNRAEKPYSSSRRISFHARHSTIPCSSCFPIPLIFLFLAWILRWHLLQHLNQATLMRWKLRHNRCPGQLETNGGELSRVNRVKLLAGHQRSRSFNLSLRKLISILSPSFFCHDTLIMRINSYVLLVLIYLRFWSSKIGLVLSVNTRSTTLD